MKFIVESSKSVDQAATDLEKAVVNNNFGVLHIHDLRATMKKKGVEFSHECRIFEVCNPDQAKKVLNEDMAINMVLPCRISVWEEGGVTKIGMLQPTALVGLLSDSKKLTDMAKDVEYLTQRIIYEAK